MFQFVQMPGCSRCVTNVRYGCGSCFWFSHQRYGWVNKLGQFRVNLKLKQKRAFLYLFFLDDVVIMTPKRPTSIKSFCYLYNNVISERLSGTIVTNYAGTVFWEWISFHSLNKDWCYWLTVLQYVKIHPIQEFSLFVLENLFWKYEPKQGDRLKFLSISG